MEVFVHSDSSQVVPWVFDPSTIIVWILYRLVGLEMLSAGLPLVISNVRVTNFTARMLGPL